jgi:hypothetical protein
VEPNRTDERYQPGALISAHWSTEEIAAGELNALLASIRSSGWMPLTVVWSLALDFSYRALVTAVPLASPYTRETSDPEAMLPQLRNLRRSLLQYATGQPATLLSLEVQSAFALAL